MTTLFFVRHVEHVLQHRVLLGRRDNAPLSPEGLKQLSKLIDELREQPLSAIYSSPRRRARATAEAIGARLGLWVQTCDELDELDYGEWSGRSFDELRCDPHWQRWNGARATECPPGGETMRALQERMVGLAKDLGQRHQGEAIACVTHAEPIRALILHLCGRPLDDFAQVEVLPGSLTRIRVMPQSHVLECVEEARSA